MHIAIIGSGQLAQMMAQAGKELGITCAFLASPGDDTAAVEGLGDIVIATPSIAPASLYHALGNPQWITVDKESVDVQLLEAFEAYCPVAPSPNAVALTQHRRKEKQWLKSLGIPTAQFVIIDASGDLITAANQLGYPFVLKSVEQGYDGKNQWLIRDESAMTDFARTFRDQQLIAEQWVAFSREVSIIGVRARSGEIQFYPLTENRHQNGILVSSRAPADLPLGQLTNKAQSYLRTVMEDCDYVGVMAMECFVTDSQLLVNELAPRVHNSGHWTQQGCKTSQFSNHLRAITGLPLGETEAVAPTAMLNILGRVIEANEIRIPNATLHWYNKNCRPGRKVGHINIVGDEAEPLDNALKALEKQIYA
jgi:5-(carboxyamino)imidazole ribonucleotide synthase